MKILIVDDDENIRHLLVKVFHAYGHETTAAANGAEALEQALAQPPDIILSDIMMPKMDGYQLCHKCKQNEQLDNIPFVFYTAAFTSDEDEKFALSLGATFIRKPTEPDVLTKKLCDVFEKAKSGAVAPAKVAPIKQSLFLTEYNKRIVAKLEEKVAELEVEITERKKAEEKLLNAMQGTIQAIALTVETRDPYTAGHQRRVTTLATSIATEMGRLKELIQGISMAGIVHDIGKIYVPAEILSKPSRLNEVEFNMIRMHCQAGYDILKSVEFPWPIAQIILQHHERMDGSGYPSCLSGEDILLEARILAVADVVEAMSSHRPYRPALGIDKALEEIAQNKGKLYDPKVTDACAQLFAEGRFKFES